MSRTRVLVGVVLVASAMVAACLPRQNPFDRDDLEDAYGVSVHAVEGRLEVRFTPLGGQGIRGYRVYREDAQGARTLVAELPPGSRVYVDEAAADAAELAQDATGNGTLWWRVAAFTAGGEGLMSRRADAASTLVLPETTIDPPIDAYVSGRASVAVLVEVTPSPLGGAPAARQFRYRFRGGEWTDPILAGPLVLTGLLDGRYTLEVAAVDESGETDLTPARATFTYDFNVPEGTVCDPAVCNAGLLCVNEPVGRFCRAQCDPAAADGGLLDAGNTTGCPVGLACRTGSGVDGGGACVAVAAGGERCDDRLCADGLACADTGDARRLCGTPCTTTAMCTGTDACVAGEAGAACLHQARLNEGCVDAACADGLACEEDSDTPRCRRLCTSTINCSGGESCVDLGRGDLRICR